MSCPNCPCADCLKEKASRGNEGAWGTLYDRQVGSPDPGPPCLYEQIVKDYAARGEPVPSVMHLHCPCRRCQPFSL